MPQVSKFKMNKIITISPKSKVITKVFVGIKTFCLLVSPKNGVEIPNEKQRPFVQILKILKMRPALTPQNIRVTGINYEDKNIWGTSIHYEDKNILIGVNKRKRKLLSKNKDQKRVYIHSTKGLEIDLRYPLSLLANSFKYNKDQNLAGSWEGEIWGLIITKKFVGSTIMAHVICACVCVRACACVRVREREERSNYTRVILIIITPFL